MPGARLEAHDEIAIVGELARAVCLRERRETSRDARSTSTSCHGRTSRSGGSDRMPDRIGRRIRLGDRPVEQRNRVVAFEIRRVREHEVREGHRFGFECVADDDEGNLVAAVRVVAHSMSRVPPVFIAEFHAMLAMNSSSVSIGYGSPATALAITMCIRPCAAIGDSHEYALSMRSGVPFSSMARSSGLVGKPSGARRAAAGSVEAVAGNCCGGIGFG